MSPEQKKDASETVSYLSDLVRDALIDKTGTADFPARESMTSKFRRLPLRWPKTSASAQRLQSYTLGLRIPTSAVPEVWQQLAGLFGKHRAVSSMNRAEDILDEACFGLEGPHESAYAAAVRLLHVAGRQYRAEGLPLADQHYWTLLGPPGPDRFGVRDDNVYFGGGGVAWPRSNLTMAQILAAPYGPAVPACWQLSSLYRHVKRVSKQHGLILGQMCTLALFDFPDLVDAILHRFTCRPDQPLEYEDRHGRLITDPEDDLEPTLSPAAQAALDFEQHLEGLHV